MKKILTIIISLFSLNCISQDNLILVFNFDSTKIYVKYTDILTVLKKENEGLKNKSILLTTGDTLHLEGFFIYSKQTKGSLDFKLKNELFALVNKNVVKIIFQNKMIISFYTKAKKERRHGKITFKGVYYFDTFTKKHFLTRVERQIWFTPYPPNF